MSDDIMPEDLASKTPATAKADLKSIIRKHDDLLMEWLAGPEANITNPSVEYVAFAAMVMIADTF
jgi:hypothetical protein